MYSQESHVVSGNRDRAVLYAEEGIEAVRNMKQDNFDTLITGTYGLDAATSTWSFVSSSDSWDRYTRSISIQEIDDSRVGVSSTVTWQQTNQRSGSVTLWSRFTKWLFSLFSETEEAEFALGGINSVGVNNADGGEVQLQNEVGWSSAALFLEENMSGNQDAQALYIENNTMYVARASGLDPELVIMDISDVSNSVVTTTDSFQINYDITDIYVVNGIAYMTSSNSSEELLMFNLSTEVLTTYDVPGFEKANSIFVIDDVILIGKDGQLSDEEFFVYSLSGVEIGSVEVGQDVNDVVANDTFVYLGTSHTDEIWIVDYDDCSPACTVHTQYALSGGSDVATIELIQNTLYFGRDNNEVGIIDVTTTSSISTSLTYDPGGDNVRDIAVHENEEYLYVVTDEAGSEELLIVDIVATTTSHISINLNGSEDTYAVVKEGAYLYIASGDSEIQIIQSSGGDWSDPQIVGTYDTVGNENAEDVFVVGNYAYVGTVDNGGGSDPEFYVLNVSSTDSVTLEDSIDFDVDINDVYVLDGFAYLATSDNSKELIVVDVQDPTDVFEVGSYNISGNSDALAVYVTSSSTVYVGIEDSSGGELYVLDASTPASISEQDSYEVNEDVNDIVVSSDGRAFLATSHDSSEMTILNVEDPTNIFLEDQYDRSGGDNALSIAYQEGNIAYLGIVDDGGSDDFYSFNVSNATSTTTSDWSSPLSIGTYNSDEGVNANDVFVSGDYAYMVTENNGGGSDPEFYIIDISDPANPSLEGQYDFGSSINEVYVSGNYAYLATDDDSQELLVLDITDKTNPIVAGTYDSDEGKDAYSIFVVGTTVYLGTDNNSGGGDHEFYILNATVPAAIVLLDSHNINADVNDIYVSGNYAYLATDHNSDEFLVLDITNPLLISEADSVNISGNTNAEGVWVDDGVAYVVRGNDGGNADFFSYDVSDPTDVSALGSVNLGSTNNAISISGDYAYVATNTNSQTITIVDISTPASPSEVGAYNNSADGNGVYAVNGTVYGATENDSSELQILNSSFSVTPYISLLDSIDLDSDNLAIFVSSTYAYVGTDDNDQGLTLVDISDPTNLAEYATYDTDSDCNGAFVSGQYAYMACEDNSNELYIIGPSMTVELYAHSGWFTSAPFDSGFDDIAWQKMTWTESGTGTIRFQLRSAPDSSGEPGVWTAWLGPTSTLDYYIDNEGTESINSVHSDGSDDRWLQYRGLLEGSGTTTPIMEDVTVEYSS